MIPDEIVEKAATAISPAAFDGRLEVSLSRLRSVFTLDQAAASAVKKREEKRDLARCVLSAVYAEIQASGIRSAADQFGVYCGDDDNEWIRGYQQAQRETIFKLAHIAAEIESGEEL